MSTSQIRAVIVGAGHRAIGYASYAKQHPEKLRIVGVADPNKFRREQVRQIYGFPETNCFETADQLARVPKIADAVINGTMDADHVDTSIPLLKAGYDILLEKPFAVNEKEMWNLHACARKFQRTVMICHVLRYAPFYTSIKKMLLDNTIGEIINLQACEHVSYHHVAVGYVRGKWNRLDTAKSTMLMAKSCHDLDLITWMMSGIRPVQVASFGNLMQFRKEKAPKNAGTRCVVDCPIESECLYSAKKHYIGHGERWAAYVYNEIEHIQNPTDEQRLEVLRKSHAGRCVWKCDNDVVDHQSVAINFENGATATLNMIGGCSRPTRTMHLIGTTGEIQGDLSENKITVRHIDPRPGHEYSTRTIDLQDEGDTTGAFGGHGGGDLRLVADFVDRLQGQTPSISCTSIDDSLNGHLIGFLADRSRETSKVVKVPRIRK